MHEQFGTYGAWLNPALGDAPRIEYAPELEELGYQTIWVGIGADPVGGMELLEQMIAATKHAIIASAIIDMWQDDARSIARHYHRIVDSYGLACCSASVSAILKPETPTKSLTSGHDGTITRALTRSSPIRSANDHTLQHWWYS